MVTGTVTVLPFTTGGKGAPLVAPRSTSKACGCKLPNTSADAETVGVHTVEMVMFAGRWLLATSTMVPSAPTVMCAVSLEAKEMREAVV